MSLPMMSPGWPLGSQRVAPTVVTLGASVATWTADRFGQFILSGGTVTLIRLSRDGGANYTDLQFIAGTVLLQQGDIVEVTYTVLPDVVFSPLF